MEDLDLAALQRFAEERYPSPFDDLEPVAIRLGLFGRSGKTVVPSVLGLLLFGHHPQLFHPQWAVSAVRIDGVHLTDPVLAREVIEGPFPVLVDQTMEFINRHTHSIPEDVLPDEVADSMSSEYPERALREAVINALVHRDLRLPGQVAVRIFDDRLEIWSPGSAAAPVEDLAELLADGGVSVPRNPLLASSTRMLGYGEQLGRGLPTIRRQVGSRSPEPPRLESQRSAVLLVIPSAMAGPMSIS